MKAALVALVEAMQGAEQRAGGALHVRDAENTISLGDVLHRQGARDGLEQYDASLVPPVGGWVEEPNMVMLRAPLLSETVFEEWLAKERLTFESEGTQYYTESYTRGVSRCLNVPEIHLKVHEIFTHEATGRRMVWLQDKVPRSQAAENESNLRTVHVLCELSNDRNAVTREEAGGSGAGNDGDPTTCRPPMVRRVLRTLCNCQKDEQVVLTRFVSCMHYITWRGPSHLTGPCHVRRRSATGAGLRQRAGSTTAPWRYSTW